MGESGRAGRAILVQSAVHKREDGCLVAVVDDELLRSPRWRRGDKIVLQHDHVLETRRVCSTNLFYGRDSVPASPKC